MPTNARCPVWNRHITHVESYREFSLLLFIFFDIFDIIFLWHERRSQSAQRQKKMRTHEHCHIWISHYKYLESCHDFFLFLFTMTRTERSERAVLQNKYQITVHITSETWIHVMKFSKFFTITRTEKSQRTAPETFFLDGHCSTVQCYSTHQEKYLSNQNEHHMTYMDPCHKFPCGILLSFLTMTRTEESERAVPEKMRPNATKRPLSAALTILETYNISGASGLQCDTHMNESCSTHT